MILEQPKISLATLECAGLNYDVGAEFDREHGPVVKDERESNRISKSRLVTLLHFASSRSPECWPHFVYNSISIQSTAVLRSERSPKLPSFSEHLDGSPAIGSRPLVLYVRRLFLYPILCAVSVFCHGQTHLVLCNAGVGNFSSTFSTGVAVTVDATKVGSFSSHTCEATLSWRKESLSVAKQSWKIDIDAMGADLGLKTSVVAFQIKDSAQDHLTTYEIYSLEQPPRLIRTITGGGFYSAGDTKLEGRTEIWTDDAAAEDGFEHLPLSIFDFAPTVVLRFESQRLIDVSSEYRPYFDHQIAQLKEQLNEQALAAFKQSDGKLESIFPLSTEKLQMLLKTKIKVLEVVWSYLYSGREEEAWRALADMWPPADFDRIRGSIRDAQARGIRRQVDGVSMPGSRPPWKHRARIYNMATVNKSVVDMASGQEMNLAPDTASLGAGLGEKTSSTADVGPEPIYLGTPLPHGAEQPLVTSKVYLNLVVDAAGKVRSAQFADKGDHGPNGDALIGATAEWKFIPAFRDGRAVACRMRFGVWPYR